MNDTWTPSHDDVEAAAKAIIEQGPSDVHWQMSYLVAFLVPCAMRVLHSRGWRDAAEVAAIEAERNTFRNTFSIANDQAEHNAACLLTVEADRDALAAKLAEAEQKHGDWNALCAHRDAARAEVEAKLADINKTIAEADMGEIRALNESLTKAEASAERLTAALAELVRLKGIKERLESWRLSPIDTEQERDDLWKHYECCKDLAWSDARQALAADTAEKETT